MSNKSDSKVENSLIFCIDNSGSMNSSFEVKGKVNLKHGLTEEEYNTLKQFIEPGDEEQIWYGQKKDSTWVSRKQCVLAAIETQLEEIKKQHPQRKVGIVTFNNEVCIYGDAVNPPEIITGDKLFKKNVKLYLNIFFIKYKEIEDIIKTKCEEKIKNSIEYSCDGILKQFCNIESKGQTALGPALLSSYNLIKNVRILTEKLIIYNFIYNFYLIN